MQNPRCPRSHGICEQRTEAGKVRSTSTPGGARALCESACCRGQHAPDDDCDACPFEAAGEPGAVLLKLLYAACTRWEDPQTKHEKWSIDRQGYTPAFDLYAITERPRAFHLLGQACAILNGDAGPLEVPEDQDDDE